ncbi:hypothetical protein F4774DRAFT_411725 [Daldinia eschscholtzii]|nr:hypothetical protein F4774DRAFT_411725 [Daldinia eschscholtzii]
MEKLKLSVYRLRADLTIQSNLTLSIGMRWTMTYISEPFTDPQNGRAHKWLWDEVDDMDKRKGIPLLVFDAGSSSLNIQMKDVFFNEAGEFLSSQSVSNSVWLSGVQGSSHISNFVIREMLTETLQYHHTSPGKIAALLNGFERQIPKDKRCLDLTVEEFPTLIPDHIPITLEHFHVQVYHHPMPDPD